MSEELFVTWMDRDDIFWQMIKAGYGDTPQYKIPSDWREVPGPDPWPSPFITSAKERKKRKPRLTKEERLQRNELIMRQRKENKERSREKRRQARIAKYGGDLSHSEIVKANWNMQKYGKYGIA